MVTTVPVITVDGPSGAGKGTISHMLAEHLGWHLLDSGALYRVTGQACLIEGVSWGDYSAVAEIARHLEVSFSTAKNGEILVAYKGLDVRIVSAICQSETISVNPSEQSSKRS